MQRPTDQRTPAARRGDEDQLFRRHHQDLERAVADVVKADPELIADACQTAWAVLLRTQPDRDKVFAWLRVVAIHEAYRLSAIARRDSPLERFAGENGGAVDPRSDPKSFDVLLEAREALGRLAALPERERVDITLLVSGYSYREIAAMTGGRTFTNVSKHLKQARARIRRATARRPPGSDVARLPLHE
jgi:RNA polymerase sigma factor (sigma-70 family)